MIKNTTIELLLIAGGGGGGAANLTSSTSDSINARGLVDPFKFEGNAELIPTFDTDAGITDVSFYYLSRFLFTYRCFKATSTLRLYTRLTFIIIVVTLRFTDATSLLHLHVLSGGPRSGLVYGGCVHQCLLFKCPALILIQDALIFQIFQILKCSVRS